MGNVNYTHYHQDHFLEPVYDTLYGHSVRVGWKCNSCRWYWKNKPKKGTCLGMPRYQIRAQRPANLFTRKELARKHLAPGSEPEGYVYVLNSPYWIFLYDIGQAKPIMRNNHDG